MTIAAIERPGATRKRSFLSRIMPLLVVLIGFAIVMYPVVGTFVRNVTQTQTAEAYTTRIFDTTTQEQREESLRRAEQWNSEHAQGPVLDPWLARIDPSNTEYIKYQEELALDDVMGRIVIPSISSDLPIYHGSDQATLEKGIGHLFGSSLPVGGPGTHAVLTGHTGLANATLWDKLVDVKQGDSFTVFVAGRSMKYEVNDIRVVLPNEADNLTPVDGEDLVTLITCTPYGVNSHRLLITGHRVPLDETEEREVLETKTNPIQPWMLIAIGVSTLVLVLVIGWFIRGAMRGRKNTDDAEEAGWNGLSAQSDLDDFDRLFNPEQKER